jgi:CRISPR-associated protein Csb2
VMGFVIEVEFLRGIYESGSVDRRQDSEWPPSPARLFNALVAVAQDGDDESLRWLEAQPPPTMVMSGRSDVNVALSREGYVPLNTTEANSAYGRFPARKAGSLQQWCHVSPRVAAVAFHWPAPAPNETLDRLAAMVGAVPYLGRSTSPVEARAENVGDEFFNDDRQVLVPGGPSEQTIVDVPRRGYLADLRAAFAEALPAHDVPRRRLSYGVEVKDGGVHASMYDPAFDILPFANRRIGPGQVMAATRALLKAIESHLDGGPLVIRGAHKGEDRPKFQVLLLGLPEVGYQHASGLIPGLAICRPRDITIGDRRSLSQALIAIEERGVVAGILGKLMFSDEPSPLRALDPARWTRASQHWVSATPMSADRFVNMRKPGEMDAEVKRACAHLGLPEPTVYTSLDPLCEGAESVRQSQRMRRAGEAPTPSFHARIEFEVKVSGPIVLGNLRRYGLGLFLPEAA